MANNKLFGLFPSADEAEASAQKADDVKTPEADTAETEEHDEEITVRMESNRLSKEFTGLFKASSNIRDDVLGNLLSTAADRLDEGNSSISKDDLSSAKQALRLAEAAVEAAKVRLADLKSVPVVTKPKATEEDVEDTAQKSAEQQTTEPAKQEPTEQQVAEPTKQKSSKQQAQSVVQGQSKPAPKKELPSRIKKHKKRREEISRGSFSSNMDANTETILKEIVNAANGGNIPEVFLQAERLANVTGHVTYCVLQEKHDDIVIVPIRKSKVSEYPGVRIEDFYLGVTSLTADGSAKSFATVDKETYRLLTGKDPEKAKTIKVVVRDGKVLHIGPVLEDVLSAAANS